jgi:hypothetical protein
VTIVTGRATSEGVLIITSTLPNDPFHFTPASKNVHSIVTSVQN